MTDLQTAIVDALNKSRIIATREVCLQQHPFREGDVIALGEKYIYQGFDADAVSEAITDYILDREKVRAALEETFKDLGVISAKVSPQPYTVDDVVYFAFAEMITGRLIEVLTGKVGA